jgi:hypothetical protein
MTINSHRALALSRRQLQDRRSRYSPVGFGKRIHAVPAHSHALTGETRSLANWASIRPTGATHFRLAVAPDGRVFLLWSDEVKNETYVRPFRLTENKFDPDGTVVTTVGVLEGAALADEHGVSFAVSDKGKLQTMGLLHGAF